MTTSTTPKTTTTSLPILIAGGGIGGLATALGLAQKGFRSLILERAPVLGEVGAGIQLGPNAFHVFDYLGVGDAARGMAVYIDKLRLMDAMSGEEITHIPLDEAFRKRFGLSIYAFVSDHRLVEAHAALARTDIPMKALAANLGYSHVNNFIYAFKKKFGYPPGSVRKGLGSA